MIRWHFSHAYVERFPSYSRFSTRCLLALNVETLIDVIDRKCPYQSIFRPYFPISVQYMFRGYRLSIISFMRFFSLVSNGKLLTSADRERITPEVTSSVDSATIGTYKCSMYISYLACTIQKWYAFLIVHNGGRSISVTIEGLLTGNDVTIRWSDHGFLVTSMTNYCLSSRLSKLWALSMVANGGMPISAIRGSLDRKWHH